MTASSLRAPIASSRVRSMILAGSALATLMASPVFAQSSESSDDFGVADIIVTAERRATSLQNTPISIVALTEELVAAKGIEDLQDLSRFTPNLSITPSRGGGNNAANFVIRGIGGGGGITGERGVGLYIDGIYMPRTSGAVLRVLDIDRIEVLRGPQGTLFGRNSTGGAIRIFSKQPDQEAAGYLRGTIGNMDRHDLVGMINLPLGEGLAIRAQGAYLDQDGFVQRGTEMLGAQRDIIGRVQARYENGSGFDATLGFLYSNSKSNGTPNVMTEFDMRPGIEGYIQGNYGDWLNDAFKKAGQAPLAAYNDPRIVKNAYTATDVCLMDDFNPDYDPACNQFVNSDYWQVDFNASLELSDKVKLTSISGYGKLIHKGTSDYEGLGMETRTENVNSQVFYQELQLNAALFGDAVDLVTGANYFHETSSGPNSNTIRRGSSVYPSNPGPTSNPNGDAGLFRTADTFVRQLSDSYGLFLNATWHVTDKLNVTGGLRQAWDKKKFWQTRYPATDFTVAPGTTSTSVHAGDTFTALDYRGTIDYHFTDDIMAYATISKAYKAGQFSYSIVSWTATNNATGDAQSAGIKPIPNEKVVNYEAGLRLSLFDKRLRLNPTFFIMDYTNRQAATQVTCGTGTLVGIPAGSSQCPVGFLIQVQNQGDVRLTGVELDMQLALAHNFTVEASGGITHPKLKNAPAGTVNLYPDVPSPTFNVGATYSMVRDFGKATLNVNYAYVGKQATHPSEGTDSSYTLPAYGVMNARIQFALQNLPVTVTFFSNNLLDKTYAVFAQRFGGGFWDSGAGTGPAAPPRSALSEVRGRPREVGLTLQYNF
ncbi:MAG: TonB-dependent receptor [Sphingomonas sp.]|nr:TonB-dependent receptor [Sphingomonas sp.]